MGGLLVRKGRVIDLPGECSPIQGASYQAISRSRDHRPEQDMSLMGRINLHDSQGSMQMVKQRATDDGSTAMDCGLCVMAMLTGLPYETILADIPNYRATSDHDWMRCLNLLGFQVDQVDENAPPIGHRLYCALHCRARWERNPTRNCCGRIGQDI